MKDDIKLDKIEKVKTDKERFLDKTEGKQIYLRVR